MLNRNVNWVFLWEFTQHSHTNAIQKSYISTLGIVYPNECQHQTYLLSFFLFFFCYVSMYVCMYVCIWCILHLLLLRLKVSQNLLSSPFLETLEHLFTRLCTCICLSLSLCMCAWICEFAWCLYPICIYICISSMSISAWVCVCICICMCVFVCVHACTCIRVWKRLYIRIVVWSHIQSTSQYVCAFVWV